MDGVFSIATMCLILHNLTASMKQNGDFRDEAGAEDLIMELLIEDEQAMTDEANEYE